MLLFPALKKVVKVSVGSCECSQCTMQIGSEILYCASLSATLKLALLHRSTLDKKRGINSDLKIKQ